MCTLPGSLRCCAHITSNWMRRSCRLAGLRECCVVNRHGALPFGWSDLRRVVERSRDTPKGTPDRGPLTGGSRRRGDNPALDAASDARRCRDGVTRNSPPSG